MKNIFNQEDSDLKTIKGEIYICHCHDNSIDTSEFVDLEQLLSHIKNEMNAIKNCVGILNQHLERNKDANIKEFIQLSLEEDNDRYEELKDIHEELLMSNGSGFFHKSLYDQEKLGIAKFPFGFIVSHRHGKEECLTIRDCENTIPELEACTEFFNEIVENSPNNASVAKAAIAEDKERLNFLKEKYKRLKPSQNQHRFFYDQIGPGVAEIEGGIFDISHSHGKSVPKDVEESISVKSCLSFFQNLTKSTGTNMDALVSSAIVEDEERIKAYEYAQKPFYKKLLDL